MFAEQNAIFKIYITKWLNYHKGFSIMVIVNQTIESFVGLIVLQLDIVA